KILSIHLVIQNSATNLSGFGCAWHLRTTETEQQEEKHGYVKTEQGKECKVARPASHYFSAPSARSAAIAFSFPFKVAIARGVLPFLSCGSGAAPLLTSR